MIGAVFCKLFNELRFLHFLFLVWTLSPGRGCRGRKLRGCKHVCTHHREDVSVWRGWGLFWFGVSVSAGRGSTGARGPSGWAAGRAARGRLMFRSRLKRCAVGARAAGNLGELNTAKPEKIGEPFPHLRTERYVLLLSARLHCVEPELLLPKRTHAALCMVHLYLRFSIAPLFLAWIFLYTHTQDCAHTALCACCWLS